MDPVAAAIGRRYLDVAGRRALRREVELRVDGLDHVPLTGPVLIAARHVHHQHDGCALWTTLPRTVRLVVALDWAKPGRDRRLMRWATASLGWPTILRTDGPAAIDDAEAARALRRAGREAVALLRAGHLLVVFPEGYPNIDPHETPKAGLDDFLPFKDGFVRFAALAERDGRTRVAIVPTGFSYEAGVRWRVTMRFGPPRYLEAGVPLPEIAREVEERVRALSGRA